MGEISHLVASEIAEILRTMMKSVCRDQILEEVDLSDEYVEELIKKLDEM